MKTRIIVIDLNNFIFRAFYAVRLLTSPDGTPINAVHGVFSMLLKLFSEYNPTHVFIAQDSGSSSFRNEIYNEYKANRGEPPEDLIPQFDIINNLIDKMDLTYLKVNKYEADDIIGSVCTQWKKYFDEILIASSDKDLMQFVGDNIKMLDTMKDKIFDKKAVFEKMGVYPNQMVDYLSIVGDASDNIPGMKGIGAKGAAKLLDEYKTLDRCIKNKNKFTGKKLVNAFENHIEDALLSRDLINIVTDVNLKIKPNDSKYKFYPSNDLISYLKELGFKSTLKKLEEMKYHYDTEGEPDDKSNFFQEDNNKYQHLIVNNEKMFTEMVSALSSTSSISLYIVYKGRSILDSNIKAISISIDGSVSYFITDSYVNKVNLDKIFYLTWGNDCAEIISSDVKKDFIYFTSKSKNIRAQSFDLSQAHYILRPIGNHSIEFMSQEYLGIYMNELKSSDEIEALSVDKLATYYGDRSCSQFLLSSWFKKELSKEKLDKIYYDMDDLFIKVLADMEREGILINKNYFKKLESEFSSKIKTLEKRISTYSSKDINLNSPKQVGEFLFEELNLPSIKKTKTGYSTDSSVLESLSFMNISEVPDLVLQYREISKLLSTYVIAIPKLCNEKTGRIHTNFNQNVTATGRLSSTHPNLQNIPIRTDLGKKIRKGFISQRGKILLSADYSQAELRLLANFSKDKIMIKTFKEDIDIHKQTAAEIFLKPLDKVSESDRAKAKTINFGLIYGQSSFSLSKQLRISRKEAKGYIDQYFRNFGSVKEYLESLKGDCQETGYAITMMGRKRFLPDINSNNHVQRSMAERIAINSPIQGSVADIIKLAMIGINREFSQKKLKSKMLLQVHDELIFECVESEIDVAKGLIKDKMENIVNLDVPMKVNISFGINWFDLK